MIVFFGVLVILSCLVLNIGQVHANRAAEVVPQTGITTRSETKTEVSTRSGLVFSSVSAGTTHTCGLQTNQKVICWGFGNDWGQSSPPDGLFQMIDAGTYSTCGIRIDGTLACWGGHIDELTPPAGTFISVSGGHGFSCGVRSNGAIACWGEDYEGQSSPPTGAFVSVSAGGAHTCGLKADGSVVCWGGNWYGQSQVPTGPFTMVNASWDHTCGLHSDGTAVCWGENFHGQNNVPAEHFISISPGADHTCGLKLDGAVICWGSDEFGQSTLPAYVHELLVNGGFEVGSGNGDTPDGWERIKPTGDVRRCTPDGKPTQAVNGRCFYNFTGTPGENSDLKQNIRLGNFAIKTGDQLTLKGYLYTKGDQINTRVRVLVKYADQPSQKIVFLFLETNYGWRAIQTDALTLNGTPTVIRMILNNKGVSGRVRYDEMSLTWDAADSSGLVPLNGILPLPAVP